MFAIPGSDLTRPTQDMRRDLADMYKLRTTGVSYAAFEARDALIHVDELILDAEEGATPTVLMHRITNYYWKSFAHDMMKWLSVVPFMFCVIRKEKIYVKDDPVRINKYGTRNSVWLPVDVPCAVPFGSVEFAFKVDEKFRTIVVPLDDQGIPRSDIIVLYARKGGVNLSIMKFETECGALLDDWRRYNELTKLHDSVAKQNAQIMPYVEHMPINEQSRLQEEAGKVEDLLHSGDVVLDKYGYEVKQEKVLRKVERPPETKIQSFVEVPSDRKLSSVQPASKLVFDMDKIHQKWISQLASTLQVPMRHLQSEEQKGLGSGGNDATVQDDMARAVRSAGDKRDELVDLLAEMYEKIYQERPKHTHLPTATHLTPQLLFELKERELMGDAEVKEEMSVILGLKRQRFN